MDHVHNSPPVPHGSKRCRSTSREPMPEGCGDRRLGSLDAITEEGDSKRLRANDERDIWKEMREAEETADEAAAQALAGEEARRAYCEALEEELHGQGRPVDGTHCGLSSGSSHGGTHQSSARGSASNEPEANSPGRAQWRTLVSDDNKVDDIIESSAEEEDDANLQDLLDLQAVGVKVILPPRKRARTPAEPLRTVRGRIDDNSSSSTRLRRSEAS